MQYKSSELGIQMVQKAKDNASEKVYHHTLGQGGYKFAKPKWDKMEQGLLLTRNDHTPSPRAPYDKLILHLIQNQDVPVNLTCKLTRK